MKMLTKYSWVLTMMLLGGSFLSLAQPSKLFYKGLGRVVIGQDQLDESSPALENDTVSDRRDLNGQFVFDLNVNVEPSDQLRVSTILRMTNEFGGFYSQGSLLQFRQVQIQGVLGEKINYQVGDIDLKLTPYTLHNNASSWYEYEASIFADRRFIMEYENFNNDDFWRLQGAQANTTLKFKSGIEKLDINAFGTRIRRSDFLASADRLFTGGSLYATVKPNAVIGLNAVHMFDVEGTAPDTLSEFQNSVITGSINLEKVIGNMKIGITGEGGGSMYQAANLEQDTAVEKNDAVMDLGLTWAYPSQLMTASAAFVYVGEDFHSPGAQSRRIYDGAGTSAFSTLANGAFARTQTMRDRISDVGIYNQELTAALAPYAYRYNLAQPYGKATPNRSGVAVDFQRGHRDSSYVFTAEAAFLNEVIGEGVEETRSFSSIKVGTAVNLHKVAGWKKDVTVTAGVKSEGASRDGNASVDATNLYIDAGLTAEFIPNLDAQVGFKYLSAKGDEFTNVRNGFSEVVSFTPESYEISESILALGARYRFSNYNFLSLTYLNLGFADKQTATNDYNMNQWFVNYTLQF